MKRKGRSGSSGGSIIRYVHPEHEEINEHHQHRIENHIKGNCESKEQESLDDNIFYDFLYGAETVVDESDAFVTRKLLEVEWELDRLCDKLKDTYYHALDQELKQGSCYLRSREFLMMFLRADNYDAGKAAYRLAKFFENKLELFGPEKLPKQIIQDDLSADDRAVLNSGFMYFDSMDTGGRVVIFFQRDRLRYLGLLSDRYKKSVSRVAFYQFMRALEDNDGLAQRKGVVAIHWNVNSSLPLKEFRILTHSMIKLMVNALPIKYAAVHHCYNNILQHVCISWVRSVVPKHISEKIKTHNAPSMADCFAELSMYGIDVDSLPLTASGDFKQEVFQKWVQHLRSRENRLKIMLEEIKHQHYGRNLVNVDANSSSSSSICTSSTTLSCNSATCTDAVAMSAFCEKPHTILMSDNNDTIMPLPFTEVDLDDTNITMNITMPVPSEDEQRRRISLSTNSVANVSRTSDENGDAHVMAIENGDNNIDLQIGSNIDMIMTNTRTIKSTRHSIVESDMNVHANTNATTSACSAVTCAGTTSSSNVSVAAEDNNMSSLRSSAAEEHLPLKLMDILEQNTSTDAIWWTRDGKAFAIEKDKFPKTVLTKEFNGIKLDSFLRRLRRWGFQRLVIKSKRPTAVTQTTSSMNCIEYSHDLFQQNCPHLLQRFDVVPKKDKFPLRLMKVLKNNHASDAIFWVNEGKAFAIERNQSLSILLEKYFEGLKLNSFQRMLTRWGFKRVSDVEESKILSVSGASGSTAFVFQHALFQKELPLSPEILEKWSSVDDMAYGGTGTPKGENFPQKLFRVLGSQDKHMRNAIWWLDCGTAFAMHMGHFSTNVLPEEFNGIKLSSFQRSLKRWGFEEVRTPPNLLSAGVNTNLSVFKHDFFRKNEPQLLIKWPSKESRSSQKAGTGGSNNLQNGSNAGKGQSNGCAGSSSCDSHEIFPKKLYRVVNNSCSKNDDEQQHRRNGIWWVQSGTAFAIHMADFSAEALTKDFKGIKFSSFQRSLKRWGFEQLQSDGKISIFQHASFQQNTPDLLSKWPKPKKDKK